MSLDIIPTKAALAKKNNLDFKVTIFEEPKFTKNDKSFKDKKDSDNDSEDFNDFDGETRRKKRKDDTEFDIKIARHEIIRFANHGIKKFDNKKKAELDLLIKLGAKPPKRPYKNYKKLLAERKFNQQLEENEQRYQQLGKTIAGNCSVKCKKRQKSKIIVDGIANHYGIVNQKKKQKK